MLLFSLTFGRPGVSRGESAFAQLRFMSLVENGTHVLFGTQQGPYATGAVTLAKAVVGALRKGMLCLADRYRRFRSVHFPVG